MKISISSQQGVLWSLFDFLSPGLLGSASRFKQFIKTLEQQAHQSFAPLRQLVQPYILPMNGIASPSFIF